ncbi:hypothetical protein A1O1_07617 [Capronia coronata CBS 617.96]|uniref:FR47-like domain-containing protein n=1 Tax=Capronia coronata CBS 617.96 TaxID=1182541 RepID=W9XMV8_9EURO|nr:uncharacterized protein A1O1_07617 [Capronia coronata CBS 617.96]EXJ81553.1 hypothetical protein A1O1_07617 [Capronia coronata CBS 617.96]
MADQHQHRQPHPSSDSRVQSAVLSTAQVPRLQAKLGRLMPYSIPLFRRIQHHATHPVPDTASIFVAVATDSADHDTPQQDDVAIDQWLQDSDSSTTTRMGNSTGQSRLRRRTDTDTDTDSRHRPWIAAHIDLAHYGSTQVWVFASWECPPPSLSTSTTSPLSSSSSSNALATTPDHERERNTQSQRETADRIVEDDNEGSDDDDPRHGALMIALYRYIYHDLVPRMSTEPGEDWLELKRTGKSLTIPYSRNKILFGTINTKLLRWVPGQARTRIDAGYLKYIFAIDPDLEDSDHHGKDSSREDERNGAPVDDSSNSSNSSDKYRALPPGYTFGPMQSAHLQAVLDRSVVPRTLATLQQFPSLGVFPLPQWEDNQNKEHDATAATAAATEGPELEPNPKLEPKSGDQMRGSGTGKPVAWGFLGTDASLSGLHTEPEHRGKGLAGCVGRELLRRSAWRGGVEGHVDVDPDPRSIFNWGHADVSIQNKASRRVMEKLGGVARWKVAWVEVDLAVALDVLLSVRSG